MSGTGAAARVAKGMLARRTADVTTDSPNGHGWSGGTSSVNPSDPQVGELKR